MSKFSTRERRPRQSYWIVAQTGKLSIDVWKFAEYIEQSRGNLITLNKRQLIQLLEDNNTTQRIRSGSLLCEFLVVRMNDDDGLNLRTRIRGDSFCVGIPFSHKRCTLKRKSDARLARSHDSHDTKRPGKCERLRLDCMHRASEMLTAASASADVNVCEVNSVFETLYCFMPASSIVSLVISFNTHCEVAHMFLDGTLIRSDVLSSYVFCSDVLALDSYIDKYFSSFGSGYITLKLSTHPDCNSAQNAV